MSPDNKRVVEWLGVALEMEHKGKAFYEKSEKAVANELGREIFRMLGADELTHIERIKKIYDGLMAGQAWSKEWTEPDARPDLTAIFHDLAAKRGSQITADTADIAALDIGVEFEAKSITFYSDLIGGAKDELEKKFLTGILAEEKGHHQALADMRFYLKDPAGYFRETEKGGLDG